MKAKGIIKNNLLMLGYIWKYTPVNFIVQTIFAIVVSAVAVIQGPVTLKFIFDALSEGKSFREILYYLIFVSIVLIIRLIYGSIAVEYMTQMASVKVNGKIREELFEKASKMDLEYYETPKFYTDFVWAASEADRRAWSVFNTFMKFVTIFAELLFMGGLMLVLDPTLFVFAAISVAIRLFFNSKIVKKRFEVEKEAKPIERERDYSSRIFYLGDYAKEIRLSKIHETLFQRFRDASNRMEKVYEKGGKQIAFYGITSGILQEAFISFGMYSYLAYEILVAKVLTFGDFGALISATERFSDRMKQIVDVTMEFREHSLYIEKFRQFLSYEPKIELQPGLETPQEIQSISFNNVSFTYTGEEKPTLKNINLTIKPNEKIAIVGYNGAGKSTLIKLLMRLYDTTSGEITLNDTNIKEFSTQAYRNDFGAVFQDYQVFAATIGENVVMDSSNERQVDKIKKALYDSGFGDRLEELDKNLDTPLTREFSKEGINLSGGEGQKIAIARIFYKNCKYVILDEPSSALDPISEYKLNETMFEVAKNKTVIFISHRLSTTCMADRIFMLEKGEIIEQGSHNELMALNGKYADMFNKQAEKYREAVS
jgi:ATP-binding cassette subfamily B protein